MPETRKHAAIVFTDIVGYTRLMGSDEEKAVDMLSRNRSIHQSCIGKFNGTLIKEIGDGILASFPLASEAVRCAIEIQKECKEQNIPLKIGIHEGEMMFSGSDVIGDGVNIASRLQEDAQEGCINISASVFRDIKNKADIHTKFIGEKTFKNVDEPIKVYKVLCEGEEAEDQPVKDEKVKTPRSKKPYYVLFGVVVLMMAIFLIWKFVPLKNKVELEKSIAVMPFDNESDDTQNEYFVNGMMEDIRNNLSIIGDLRVISKTSTEKYRETNLSTKEIAKELGVNYLLEGTVQKQGNQVKIHAQLIEAEIDDHIWADTYLRDISEVFKVQAEIAQMIANELYSTITPEEKEIIEAIPTTNLTAYDLYLRGKDYYYKGGEVNFNTAIHFYQKAIELDPEFSLAYVWLGILYNEESYWSDYFKETFADTLFYYANKALSINPDLENGYWLLSKYYTEKGEFDKSIIQLKKAIDLNPNYGDAYQMLGNNYSILEHYIDTYINFQKAKKLNIGSPEYKKLLGDIWLFYFNIGDYDKVESICKEIQEYDLLAGYKILGFLYTFTGEYEKLQKCADIVCEIDSGETCINMLTDLYTQTGRFIEAEKYQTRNWDYVIDRNEIGIQEKHRIAYMYWNLGERDTAEYLFDIQIKYCQESIRLKRKYSFGGAYYDLAGIFTYLEKKTDAYDILHEMENERFRGSFIWYIQVDPLFESLWEDEEFKAIIQRQEKKYADIRAEIDRLEEEGLL